MQYKFKREKNLDERRALFNNIMQSHPTKIPIICERYYKSPLNDLEKTKYLIPSEYTVSHFMIIIRTKIHLSEEEAFFIFAKEKYTLTGNTNMKEIYDKYKDKEDGFLYLIYASKEIWG